MLLLFYTLIAFTIKTHTFLYFMFDLLLILKILILFFHIILIFNVIVLASIYVFHLYIIILDI